MIINDYTDNVMTSERSSQLVLVVDDENEIRGLVCRLLAVAGYRVVEATGGESMLIALANHGRPAAIVLDQQMPGLEGARLIRAIRAAGYDGVLVLASASANAKLASLAVTDGADAFLDKLDLAERLLPLIARLMDQRRSA